jgi:hypothetical protein
VLLCDGGKEGERERKRERERGKREREREGGGWKRENISIMTFLFHYFTMSHVTHLYEPCVYISLLEGGMRS